MLVGNAAACTTPTRYSCCLRKRKINRTLNITHKGKQEIAELYSGTKSRKGNKKLGRNEMVICVA